MKHKWRDEKEGNTKNRYNFLPSREWDSTKDSKNKYIIKRHNNVLLYAWDL